MHILAGTSRGVYRIGEGAPQQTLESRGVRDLNTAGDRVFAGTGAGLYYSDDGGRSWSSDRLNDYEVWQIRADAEGRLYAGTQPAGLFSSEDQGDTWQAMDAFNRLPELDEWCIPIDPPVPPRARALVVDQTNSDRLWVGVEVGGILMSTDGGSSWQLVCPGDNPDLHMMVVHPEHPDELYASTGYGRLDGVAEMVEGNAGMFRSTDGGLSWEYVWKGITPRYSRPLCMDPRPPYPITVASAPTAFSSYRDEGGAGAMLFRTDDGGASWRSLCDQAHSPSSANVHGLAPHPETPGAVLVGTDTGEVWQVTAEAEWTLLAEGLPAVLSVTGVDE